jgi:hypothetical protein
LLVLYGHRWGIERCFQQVTEVFGLQGLIGSSPRATVFQFAFCLVLYNILQLIRAYVADASAHKVSEVSTEAVCGRAKPVDCLERSDRTCGDGPLDRSAVPESHVSSAADFAQQGLERCLAQSAAAET